MGLHGLRHRHGGRTTEGQRAIEWAVRKEGGQGRGVACVRQRRQEGGLRKAKEEARGSVEYKVEFIRMGIYRNISKRDPKYRKSP